MSVVHDRRVQRLREVMGMTDKKMIDISVHAIRSEARRQGIDLSDQDRHGINALWDNIWRTDPETVAGQYYMGAPEWAADVVIKRVLEGEVTDERA